MTSDETPAGMLDRIGVDVMDDVALLLAVRAGDADASAELWHRCVGDARRFARSLVRDSDVDDVVAEAFAKMLRALKSDRGPVDHPARYLMVAVRTTAFTMTSKQARANELANRLASDDVVTDMTPDLGDDRIMEAFATLSPRWRKVLWLAEVEGLSPLELGERLDLTPAAASALAYRARRALREAYLLARTSD